MRGTHSQCFPGYQKEEPTQMSTPCPPSGFTVTSHIPPSLGYGPVGTSVVVWLAAINEVCPTITNDDRDTYPYVLLECL
jgi:hypothetical protein